MCHGCGLDCRALCERLRESAPGAARAAVLQHLAPQIAALPRLAAPLLEAPSKYKYGVKHVSGGYGIAGPCCASFYMYMCMHMHLLTYFLTYWRHRARAAAGTRTTSWRCATAALPLPLPLPLTYP